MLIRITAASAAAIMGALTLGCGDDSSRGAAGCSGASQAVCVDGGELDAVDGSSAKPDAELTTDAQAPQNTPNRLPAAPSSCPKLLDGDVMFGATKVRVWVGDDGSSLLGPLVLYWHGTCSDPREASFVGIGPAGIARIKALGGMVAAIDSPYKSPDNFCQATGIAATTKCPGISTGNGVWCREDFDVADQIVACAIQQVGIDPRRIHTVGMSAGGVMAVEYGDARSGYIASLTSYSGGALPGLLGAPIQDTTNKFAAMIVHGGARDVVNMANFPQLADAYQKELTARGQFSFICDHGMGHTIPAGIGAATVQFFEDHPFGVAPEPYRSALPTSFPAYCQLP